MQITQENISDLNALVKIQINKDDYQPLVEKSIKDYSKKVSLKGFRPGKVPTSLVKKVYGNAILSEELNKMINDKLNSYIKDNELDILGNPLPQKDDKLVIDVLDPKDYEFVYELGLAPDFKLSLLEKKPKFDKYIIKVEDSEVDEEVNKLRKRVGTTVNPDNMEEEDFVHATFTEVDKDGNVVEDGVVNSSSLPISMIADKKLKTKFLALKKGEEMQLDIFKFIDKSESEIAKYILNIEEDRLGSMSKQFSVKVDNINRIEPAELNEEFFNKIYGEGVVTNLDELKEKISKELEDYYANQSDRQLTSEIVETLMEKTEIPLPDEFLKKWIQEMNEKPIAEEEVDKDYPSFAKNLKWSLIVNKIAEQNSIKVESEEIIDKMKENVRNQLMQYGYMDFQDEHLNAYVKNLLQDQEQVRKTRDLILEDKIFDHVKSQVTLKDKEITVEKFVKLISKE